MDLALAESDHPLQTVSEILQHARTVNDGVKPDEGGGGGAGDSKDEIDGKKKNIEKEQKKVLVKLEVPDVHTVPMTQGEHIKNLVELAEAKKAAKMKGEKAIAELVAVWENCKEKRKWWEAETKNWAAARKEFETLRHNKLDRIRGTLKTNLERVQKLKQNDSECFKVLWGKDIEDIEKRATKNLELIGKLINTKVANNGGPDRTENSGSPPHGSVVGDFDQAGRGNLGGPGRDLNMQTLMELSAAREEVDKLYKTYEEQCWKTYENCNEILDKLLQDWERQATIVCNHGRIGGGMSTIENVMVGLVWIVLTIVLIGCAQEAWTRITNSQR